MKLFNRKSIALLLCIMLALTVVTPASAAIVTTIIDSAGVVGSHTSLKLNSSGFPVISYYDTTNGDLKLAVCGDAACATRTIATVDSGGNVGRYTSLELNSSGYPVISYYDITNQNLKVAVCSDAVCSAATINTVDSVGDVGEFTSLELNASGYPVISYSDWTNSDLKVAVCNDAVCATATLTTVDNSPGVGGLYTSLALNGSGYPVISYLDSNNADLKVAVCGNATCGSVTLVTVDSAGTVGYYTSLALNSSGYPVISYTDFTNSSLKVAVCNDAACTSPTLTTVDNTGDTGYHTFIKLNASGYPVISYYDNSAQDLRIAVCNNAVCSAPTLITADSAGNVGTYSSLVLDSRGYPVVSYYDNVGADLRLATIAPPTVTSTSLLPTYVTGPSSFTVTFSENVYNPAGNSASDDVTNPANYLIVENGADNAFQTASCAGGLAGDDTQTTPSSVTYAPNTATVNLGAALPDGSYRLFVCDTIVSADGFFVPLNDGLSDYTFDFIVSGPPTVISTSLQPTYVTGPNSFTVTFNKDVYNPAGNSNPDDVDNPANYLIVEDGVDNAFNTVSCVGGLAGDDTQTTPSGVIYAPNTSIVNLGLPLPNGNYRLFVCGTTSIVSNDGLSTPLNNGVDYTFDFVVNMAPTPTPTITPTPTPTPLFTATPPSTATTPLPTTIADPASLPNTGFAPNKVTTLPIQPAELAYSALGDIWLEIPSLNVKSTIVGVPQADNGAWNVDWLGADTGWLNGSAFPTWNGNSVLTAHVTDANGLPGPFASIKDLKYGERIIVHLYGQKYVYEITDSRMSFPSATGFAFQSMRDHSYLTLVTCQGYNPVSESYLFRRLIRAVLIEVK